MSLMVRSNLDILSPFDRWGYRGVIIGWDETGVKKPVTEKALTFSWRGAFSPWVNLVAIE